MRHLAKRCLASNMASAGAINDLYLAWNPSRRSPHFVPDVLYLMFGFSLRSWAVDSFWLSLAQVDSSFEH